MISISEECIIDLKSKYTPNSTEVPRKCIHENSLSMQIMLILLPPGVCYPFFKNKSPGKILFTILEGDLTIATISEGISITKCLARGQIVCFDKTIYRSTYNATSDICIYLETIDGPFSTDDKDFLA